MDVTMASPGTTDDLIEWRVGKMVKVQARTWPGINKPGGIGQIQELIYKNNDRNELQSILVRYSLGGKERVPLEYVDLAPEYETSTSSKRLRDRSVLLGRCSRCGSLRKDCGSCDWHHPKESQPSADSRPTATKRRKPPQQQTFQELQSEEFDNFDSDDSDDSSLLPILGRRNARTIRNKTLFEESSSSSSEEDDEEQQFIANLRKSNRRIRQHFNFLKRRVKETAPDRAVPPKSSPPPPPPHARGVPDQDEFNQEEHGHLPSPTSNSVISLTSPKSPSQRYDAFHQSPPNHEQEYEVPTTSSQQVMLVDDDLEGFLQPEGAATQLPQDLHDDTLGISYLHLPRKFHETLQIRLLEHDLPELQHEWQQLKDRIGLVHQRDQKGVSDLSLQGWDLYNKSRDSLVKHGIDQGRHMLQRLESRREYQLHKHCMTKARKLELKGEFAKTFRDDLFDLASEKVEQFLRQVRTYLLDKDGGGALLENEGFGEGLVQSDDTSNDDSFMQIEFDESNQAAPVGNRELSPFDPHKHATLVRKDRETRIPVRRNKKPGGRKRKRTFTGLASLHADEDSRSDTTYGNRSTKSKARTLNEDLSDIDTSDDDRIGGMPSRGKERETVGISDDSKPKLRNGVRSSSTNAVQNAKHRNTHVGSTKNSVDKSGSERLSTKKGKSKEAYPDQHADGNTGAFDDDDDDEGYNHAQPTTLAPSLEEMLDSAPRNHAPIKWRPRDEKLAVDRMADFLKANNGNPGTTPTSRAKESINRRRTKSGEQKEAASPSRRNGRTHHMTDLLFRNLAQTASDGPSVVPEDGELCCRTREALKCLSSQCHPMSADHGYIHDLLCRSEIEAFRYTREDAVAVFSSAHSYLKSHSTTLQELVATKSVRLSRHVRVLSSIVTLFQKVRMHTLLRSEDGMIFRIFGDKQPCYMLQELVLQTLDVLYGCFNPTAWAMEENLGCFGTLAAIAPLRDALSEVVPLLELSCQYLLSRVETQQWYQSRDARTAYVSSIDPEAYRCFLRDGHFQSEKPRKVRLRQLKSKMYPRNEINALWSILGYLANAKEKVEPVTAKSTWATVNLLLGCETGVLPKSLDGDLTSLNCPKEDHMSQCEKEMGYVALLLSRGWMSPFPSGTDNILTNMIKRSLLLQACKYHFTYHNCFDSDESIPTKDEVDLLWEATAFRQTNCKRVIATFTKKQFLFSGLQQCVIDLLGAWLSKIGANPVLCSQLASSLKKLEKMDASFKNTSRPITQRGEDFAAAFAPVLNENADTAAYVCLLRTSVMIAFDYVRNIMLLNGKKTLITKDYLTRIWSQLANSAMKIEARKIMGEPVQDVALGHSSSSMECFGVARSMLLLALAQLDCPVTMFKLQLKFHPLRNPNIKKVQSNLCAAFSYIVALLNHGCDVLKDSPLNSRHTALARMTRTFSLLSVFVCHGRARLVDKDVLPEDRQHFQELGRSSLDLSASTMRKCLGALFTNADQDGVLVCFRTLLSVIRGIASLTNEASSHAVAPEDDDEFGGLDDSLLDLIESGGGGGDDCNVKDLMEFIQKALIMAFPSQRFTISRPEFSLDSEVEPLPPFATDMIVRFAGGLASCLVALANCKHSNLANFVDGLSSASDADDVFKQDLCFVLFSEAFQSHTGSEIAKHFFEQRKNHVMRSLLCEMMSATSLERFSSCDIETIASLSGTRAAQTESNRLRIAAKSHCISTKSGEEGDGVGSHYASNNLWKFRDGIVRSAQTFDQHTLPLHYKQLCHRMDLLPISADVLVPWSLEHECLKRLAFLQHFFLVSASYQSEIESTLLEVLSVGLKNTLSISEGLQYLHGNHNRFENRSVLSRKHGKVMLLHCCYIEMLFSILTSIVFPQWTMYSESFQLRALKIRDVLFVHSIQGGDFTRAFQEVAGLSVAVPVGQCAIPTLQRRVRITAIRRFREYILHSTQYQDRSGLIALIRVLLDSEADCWTKIEDFVGRVASCFTLENSVTENVAPKLLVEVLMDQLATKTSANQPLSAEETRQLIVLRRFTIKQVLPKLIRMHDITQAGTGHLINLASKMLRIEFIEESAGMDVEELTQISSMLWFVLRKIVFLGEGETASLLASFRCVVMAMRLRLQSGEALIAWSTARTKDVVTSHGGSALSNLDRLDLRALYIFTLAAIMTRTSESITSGADFTALRRNSCHAMWHPSSLLPFTLPDTVPDLVAILVGLDALLLSDKENHASKRNVYAKNQVEPEKANKTVQILEVSEPLVLEAKGLLDVLGSSVTNLC